jgi:hypothetical protein
VRIHGPRVFEFPARPGIATHADATGGTASGGGGGGSGGGLSDGAVYDGLPRVRLSADLSLSSLGLLTADGVFSGAVQYDWQLRTVPAIGGGVEVATGSFDGGDGGGTAVLDLSKAGLEPCTECVSSSQPLAVAYATLIFVPPTLLS